MRFLVPLAAVVIAALSILPDTAPFSRDTMFCRWGFCRFDQIFSRIDSQGISLDNVGALLEQDPMNPLVWCVYGDLLAQRGQIEESRRVFEQAVLLGPEMPPVLMRAANFDFAHDRIDDGKALAYRVLKLTGVFDEILFSYLTTFRIPMMEMLGPVIPATTRAGRAWVFWLSAHGTETDLLQTWSWMQQNHIADIEITRYLTWALWQRKSFSEAQKVWADWLGSRDRDYLHPQRLTNTGFQYEPEGSPFDWTLVSPASVQLLRSDGLEIRFSGTENVDFSQVHQFATVKPGRYRFAIEASAMGLTTDQVPLVHIFDPLNGARLSVEKALPGETGKRSWMTLDFDVKSGTETVQVQIERHPSQHFDNKIAGTVHVYQVSLTPLS